VQLSKIVEYHKAIGDPTRIRILFLLKNAPMHGQSLAEKLGVSAPTITHHMDKLRNAGIVKERRDGNAIYFEVNQQLVRHNTEVILDLIFGPNSGQGGDQSVVDHERFQKSVLNNFFTKDGSLKQIPAQRKRKLVVFEYLLRDLRPGQRYSEKELNEYIQRFHEDFCTIRREFIINQFMYREHGVYELNPREMWVDWRCM
jgi:hypothetical protein